MRTVLSHIHKLADEMTQLPMYSLVKDDSKSVDERLVWAPYGIPFNMNYTDFNTSVLRGDPDSPDLFQRVLNEHTVEEDWHWHWLLQDLITLGYNVELPLIDATRFFWSDDLANTRLFPSRLAALCQGRPASHRYAVVQCVESGSVRAFEIFKKHLVFPASRGKLLFFGQDHSEAEAAHVTLSDEDRCKDVVLPPEVQREMIALADEVYKHFRAMLDEVHDLGQRYGTDFRGGIADIVSRNLTASTARAQEWLDSHSSNAAK